MSRRVVFTALFAAVVACFLITRTECQTMACGSQTTCESCLKEVKCLWCRTNNTCTDYPASHVLPPSSVCQLSEARWGVCWLNFEALIIGMAVVGGIVLIGVTVCCCCCCGCCGSSSRLDRDEERFTRRREEIRQRSEERKVERKSKHDEIRKKYGLLPDSDHPYSRFDND